MSRVAVLTGLFALVVGVATAPDPPPAGFVALVGDDLKGWQVRTKDKAADGSKTWAVKDGVLSCTGKPTGCLLTEKEFADYTLRLEYRFLPTDLKRPNGGVLVHCQKGDHCRYHPEKTSKHDSA